MTKSLATQIKEARRQEAKLEQAAAAPGREVAEIETIKIINGWRLTRTDKPGARWMLWHPGDPSGLGRNYYARVTEIDCQGLYGQKLSGEVGYTTLHCAGHVKVEGTGPSFHGNEITIGRAPSCKWCGELWERIESRRAGGSDVTSG